MTATGGFVGAVFGLVFTEAGEFSIMQKSTKRRVKREYKLMRVGSQRNLVSHCS